MYPSSSSLVSNCFVARRCLLAVFLWFAASAWHVAAAQQSTLQDHCRGLHAGITAELTQGYREPSVMVGFLLLNDSEKTRNTAPESWRIIIDGEELKDSDWIFGNGPAPTEGYGTLAPGSVFRFGKALSIAQYFPVAGDHRVSWKGTYFESPTVTVRIPTSKH